MAKELVDPQQNFDDFKEKLSIKIRDDIGNMIPDEVIKGLIEEAVKDAFFKPRIETEGSGYYTKDVEKPSWFVEEVTRQAEPIITAHVVDFINEHQKEIDEGIKKYISEQNITLLATAALGNQFGLQIDQALNNLLATIKQGY